MANRLSAICCRRPRARPRLRRPAQGLRQHPSGFAMPPDTKSGLRRTRNARFAGFTKRADRARCPRRHCYPTLSADGSSSRPCQSSPRWSVRMVSCLFVRRGGGVSCPGAAKKPEWAAGTRRHRRDSSVAHSAKEEVSSRVTASPSRIGSADPSPRRGSWSRVAQKPGLAW